MNHLDITDLLERCDKKLFLNEFDDSDNMNHESIIDELWYNAHDRLDSILSKDLDLVERAIQHNQLEQQLIDMNYCYYVEQCDSWIHDTYLTEDQISESQYELVWKKIKADPRHITNTKPDFFKPVSYKEYNI